MINIKKLVSSLNQHTSLFEKDIAKDVMYLNSFKKPKNKLQRSYFQYKCQNFDKRLYVRLRSNLIAILILFPSILFLIIKGLFKRKKKFEEQQKNSAVHIFLGIKDVIPQALKNEFVTFEQIDFAQNWYLKITDLSVILNLLFYIRSPYFVFKCISKIAIYRGVIDKYYPGAIICTSEYSFTSSVLTLYCNLNEVKHINVMHGEKLLSIRDSFFEFDKCFVWDIHYANLFKELRADKNQFKIDTPPSLYFKKTNKKPEYKYTYYLGSETETDLVKIKGALSKLKIHKSKICIRSHPRYTDLNIVKKVFKMFEIEDTKDVSIEESVNNTQNVISLYSTVLYQSLISGKSIVIDDVSQPLIFKKLNDLSFILLSKPHNKLSEII